jgi:hypothetical protein
MNTYEITYQVPRSGAGVVKEQVTAGSEQDARNLLRTKFGQREVQIIGGRMTSFGGGRDERRDGKR